jgi:6-phosphogluconolactonase
MNSRCPPIGSAIYFKWMVLAGCLMSQTAASAAVVPPPEVLFVGTFTNHGSKGIYRMRFDPATGALSEPELAAEAVSPAFLALSPNGRFLYSVNEIDAIDGKPEGGVSSFALDSASGGLTFLNRQRSAGAGPTHLSVDREGRNVLVANYTSGSVAVLPIGADGKLGEPSSVDQHRGHGADPSRQAGPHAHFISPDPQGRFVLSCDLGLDKVFVYRFDPAKGTLAANDPPAAAMAPASGPRHLAFNPDGTRLYVTNEMSCTVTGFNYDAERGTLNEFQTISTLPEGFHGEKSTAEITVHPSGKFLYVSNRGDANSIAAFRIDPSTGKLTPIGHTSTKGRAPRYFGLDPSGNWLLAANQDTDNVVVFRVNPATGTLHDTAVNVKVPTPVCLTFVPAGR